MIKFVIKRIRIGGNDFQEEKWSMLPFSLLYMNITKVKNFHLIY